jgi:hypothetical protein
LPARHNLRRLPACALIWVLSSVGLSRCKFLPSVKGEGGNTCPSGIMQLVHWARTTVAYSQQNSVLSSQKSFATITNEISWFPSTLHVIPYIMDPLLAQDTEYIRLRPWVLWHLDQRVTALARPRSNCTSKLQICPLVREGVPTKKTANCQTEKKIWTWATDGGPTQRQADRMTVGRNFNFEQDITI